MRSSAFVVFLDGDLGTGKTTLVKRLTGMETDNLLIEKQRGMSIELGFAHFKGSKNDQIIHIRPKYI